jgi:hypothetical protein
MFLPPAGKGSGAFLLRNATNKESPFAIPLLCLLCLGIGIVQEREVAAFEGRFAAGE